MSDRYTHALVYTDEENLLKFAQEDIRKIIDDARRREYWGQAKVIHEDRLSYLIIVERESHD